MKYVTCFLFNKELDQVLLLKKIKGPEGIAGKWNAPGGKIEDGETSLAAIMRETIEETGLVIAPHDWLKFHHFIRMDGNEVVFYTAIIPDDQVFSQIEAEVLELKAVEDIVLSFIGDNSLNNSHVYNLSYLIPMALGYHTFPQFRYIEK
jgi:8-oxo-dGTP pyrophosphatase MutT (NUDIX family)